MDLNVLTLRHPRTLLRIAIRKLFRRRAAANARRPAGPDREEQPFVDVQDLIRSHSIDDLNATAERYFSSLESWDFHLAKPFGNISDAPALLINFAVALQGLRLRPGHRVLDFGAGTGWTAHYLTQLGCEVILLDVSATALEIARERFRRQPIVGSHTPPSFLTFDGRRIDLETSSIDRILCFDAFHHAPNPDEVIAEFGRILRPGGIAAFAEPGPQHSRTSQSQAEMRSYGVIENDVDLDSIWTAAKGAGFRQIEVAAFNIPPFRVSAEDYEDLLAGGEPYLRWAEQTRAFLRDVRNFFLHREGKEQLDSRVAGEALRADIAIQSAVYRPDRRAVEIVATVSNVGEALWLPSGTVPGGVSLGCHLADEKGSIRSLDHHWEPIGATAMEPGNQRTLEFSVPLEVPGQHVLEFDCVADGICWFEQVGSPTARVEIDVPA